MKKLIGVLCLVMLLTGCKKSNNNNAGPSPCTGGNLCFKMDGVQKIYTAKWMAIAGPSPRTRILWEEGSGASYKNIELDIYGATVGSYTVSATPVTGQAGFQYFEATGPVNIQGQSGTVKLDAFDGTTLTGTFTITALKGGTTVTITEGNFVAVPK